MENEELRGGMSRRTAIKSVAAGTALAWAAPAITTMGGSAFAQDGSPLPACTGQDFQCDVVVECGTTGPLTLCVCDVTVEGDIFCWENFFCDGAQPCASSADCANLPGYTCVTTCCGTTCAPPCGENLVTTTTSGRNAANR